MSARAHRRVWIAAAVAVALAATIGTWVTVAGRHGSSQLAAARTHSASAPCAAPTDHPALTHHMIVLGASYTAGVGASDPQDGYARQVAAQLGERARVYGVPGTGFVDPGARHQGTFLQRLHHIPVRPAPDLVLIQGGRDDRHAPPRLETTTAEATICAAERRFAGARLVVLGPIPARFPLAGHVVGIDLGLRQACRDEHVRYLDPIAEHWMTPASAPAYEGRVPDHPNDAGYRYIAERVTADLRSADDPDDG
ncbi:SGNH/GDSL hydrolase family protein [uncultured Jatrophihabitans sp.]|uniref:SGNH/GDSL hydrolase family protein n=1 Tax=uncultured Jatrophihabitans sp. TaxID=1610747 RepID=UPI0035CB299E